MASALLVLLGLAGLGAPSAVQQLPIISPSSHAAAGRTLQGRFLHITDIHPDPFYKLHSDTDEGSCHHGKGAAGPYGAQKSDCDSPYSLVNATFDWIDKNLKDDIDFVVWTGDSARHDNDESIPRNEKQVMDQNAFLTHKMREVFGKPGGNHRHPFTVPIIPTFGNNDILPHNIFGPGPNKWTTRFASLWKDFIPEEQKHQFERGGWFSVEVIPNKLAVFSLNTMYFFGSNAVVDGCKSKSEPGYEHFEWLRIQLQILRSRGMKAIISGHVPPARNEQKVQWDETCWQKYSLWTKQYRDVIIGSLWGHMNIEHFFLQDFNDIKKKTYKGRSIETSKKGDDDISVAVKPPAYLTSLRDQWAKLPRTPKSAFAVENDDEENEDEDTLARDAKSRQKKLSKYHDAIGGEWGERFAASFVSASVVPNFFPTMRVFEYNISGLEDALVAPVSDVALPPELHADDEEPGATPEPDTYEDAWPIDTTKKKHKSRSKKRKHKKTRFTVPQPPSPAAPPGPAYSPQTLSWLGYKQLFANLTYINNEGDPSVDGDEPRAVTSATRKRTKPRPFTFELEYDTRNASDVYELAEEGITVRSLVRLAGRIGRYRPDKGDEMGVLDAADRSPDADEVDADADADEPDPSDEDGDEDDQDEDDDVSTTTNKKKHHKKHKHKKHKHKTRRIINRTWFAFVDRAVVRTLTPDELHEQFGEAVDDDDGLSV